MIKHRTTLNITLTVALCVVAPYIFILINSYLALLLVPTIQALGLKAKFGVVLTIGVMNSLGALLAAAVICIPFGWAVRERGLLYGAIVGAAASLFFSIRCLSLFRHQVSIGHRMSHPLSLA